MRKTLPLLVFLLTEVPLGAQRAERAAFVVRIGTDTVAVEQISRSPGRLEGRCVVRTGRTMVRDYSATVARDGSIGRFEVRAAGQPNAVTLEFTGAQTGALPFVSNCWGLLELATRRLAASGMAVMRQPVLRPGADPDTITIERRSRDSLIVTVIEGVPYAVAVDGLGRIRGAAWAGDWVVQRVPSLDMAALAQSFATRPLGTLSPTDSMRTTVGDATLAVTYGRPKARGRVVFGRLVPWDQVWRTGANEATLFTTSADLELGGATIPAGTYTLWTVPGASGWKLIVNTNTGQWGTDYDARYDLVRLDMRVETLPAPVEQFTIGIQPLPSGDAGVLTLDWATTRALIELRPARAVARGAFVTRLGTDTLAVEEYTRTAVTLSGQQVVRAPRSVHRLYKATFAPDGALLGFELITHNISGSPGPAETRATLEFLGDTAVVRVPRGDSMATVRIPAAAGALPYATYTYALVEELARRARATGADSVALKAINLGNAQLVDVSAKRGAAGAYTMTIGSFGPLAVVLDGAGALGTLSARETTVKLAVERVASIPMATLGPTFAPRSLGTLSGRDTARVTLGGAEVLVHYGVPSKRGRVIFGDLVPWGQVWRTGANAATQIHTAADLVIGRARVPAGQYTLWTVPTPTGWTLVINRKTKDARGAALWGTMYDSAEDLVRVPLKVERVGATVEQFAISLEPRGNRAVLAMVWDQTRVSVEVSRK